MIDASHEGLLESRWPPIVPMFELAGTSSLTRGWIIPPMKVGCFSSEMMMAIMIIRQRTLLSRNFFEAVPNYCIVQDAHNEPMRW